MCSAEDRYTGSDTCSKKSFRDVQGPEPRMNKLDEQIYRGDESGLGSAAAIVASLCFAVCRSSFRSIRTAVSPCPLFAFPVTIVENCEKENATTTTITKPLS